MSFSIENLKSTPMVQKLAGLVKNEKAADAKPEKKLLPQQKEGDLNTKQMAQAILQANNNEPSIEEMAKDLLNLVKNKLKNGVKDEETAMYKAIEDIAAGKINLNKIIKTKRPKVYGIIGKDGKKYAVKINVLENKLMITGYAGTPDRIQDFIDGKTKDFYLVRRYGTCSSPEVLKALPKYYSEN